VKPRHSPGPWTAEGPDEIFGDYNIHEPLTRAAIGAVVSNLRPPEEVAANARLAAASPEMLAALDWIARHTPDDSVHHAVAKAAILKATGGLS